MTLLAVLSISHAYSSSHVILMFWLFFLYAKFVIYPRFVGHCGVVLSESWCTVVVNNGRPDNFKHQLTNRRVAF